MTHPMADAMAHATAGRDAMADKRYADARTAFEAAVAADPLDPRYPLLAGLAAKHAGALDEAAAWFRRSLTLDPRNADSAAWLTLVLRERDEPEQALEASTRALALDATHGDALMARANALYDLDRTAEALATLEQLRIAKGDSARIAWNRGFFRLTLEDFADGWADHEARFDPSREPDAAAPDFGTPWRGEPLEGKRVIVAAEQGLGDQLMMLRFARGLKQRGAAEVIAQVDGPIVRLVASCPFVDAVLPMKVEPPAADFVVPAGSLPHLLGVGSDLYGDAVPYLRAVGEPPEGVRLALDGPAPLRVGLVWGGEPRNASDHLRSIPLAELLPLLRLPGIRWVSLQKGEKARQLDALAPDDRARILDVGAVCGDFADTAHAIARLDLVITVCTSVAHAAGALGAPTWVLLRKAADWRWFRGRSDSPWYPTARLFRQRERGDWGPVVLDVARALVELLRRRASAPR